MNSKYDWIREQTALWVKDGLIEPSQAIAINQRYEASAEIADTQSVSSQSKGGWVQNILSAAGAGIFGLGVILFFAYNWAAFPKSLKLSVIFLGVIGFHLGARWLESRQQDSLKTGNQKTPHARRVNSTLVESLHVAGTMLFGAGIWLIAQIYHINEHFPTAFAIWGLAALVMAWLLPSVIQGLIATAAITAWGFSEFVVFDNSYWYVPTLLAGGIGSLAWWLKSRALLFASLLSVLFLTFAFFEEYFEDGFVFYLTFFTASLMILLSYATRFSNFRGSKNIFLFIGGMTYLGFLFVFTTALQSGFSPEFYSRHTYSEANWILPLYALSFITWILVLAIEYRRGAQATDYLHYLLIALTLLMLCFQFAGYAKLYFNLQLVVFNAILALHAVLLILTGTSRPSRRHLALGSVILLAVVSMRFGDLFHSLLMRSLAFVVFGAALVYTGYRYNKVSQQAGDSNA